MTGQRSGCEKHVRHARLVSHDACRASRRQRGGVLARSRSGKKSVRSFDRSRCFRNRRAGFLSRTDVWPISWICRVDLSAHCRCLRHRRVSAGIARTYQIAVEAVRDHDSGQHNFHRWETEVQQRIPGFRAGQRLTLHGFLATTNSGADVPFYMLYTLGGSGGLKAFRPDLLGSDGTRATLRSFRNYPVPRSGSRC